MSIGNIYNDIDKGLYDLAICEIKQIKSERSHLAEICDKLICLVESYKNGVNKYKKDYGALIDLIIKNY